MKNANLVSRAQGWLPVVCAALLLASCDGAKEPAPVPVKTVADFFAIRVGAKTVRMQLAVLPDEMQHGLMGRRDLGRDEGMLFVYDRPQALSFWMRNTPTPLDIGFISPEGVLEEIYPMFPFDETPVPSQGRRLLFALETNQGWYRQNGVQPGARLDLKALAAAMKERGFEPKKIGLAE